MHFSVLCTEDDILENPTEFSNGCALMCMLIFYFVISTFRLVSIEMSLKTFLLKLKQFILPNPYDSNRKWNN